MSKSKHILSRREQLRKFVEGRKAERPCMDCGYYFDTVCMDFDHRNPAVKLFTISQGVNKCVTLEVLEEELDKCDLVCANCHRLRTQAQREKWREEGSKPNKKFPALERLQDEDYSPPPESPALVGVYDPHTDTWIEKTCYRR